jgi:hypothetical protein
MNKRKIIIAIFIIATGLYITWISLPKKMEINSSEIANKQQRIENLSKEIAVFSEILDAEYNLFNSSGFGMNSDTGLGPTDTDYKFAIKVKPGDVQKWKKRLIGTKGDINNEHWIQELIQARKQNWLTSATPVFYTQANEINATIVIYEKEGIIFKSIVQQ